MCYTRDLDNVVANIPNTALVTIHKVGGDVEKLAEYLDSPGKRVLVTNCKINGMEARSVIESQEDAVNEDLSRMTEDEQLELAL